MLIGGALYGVRFCLGFRSFSFRISLLNFPIFFRPESDQITDTEVVEVSIPEYCVL